MSATIHATNRSVMSEQNSRSMSGLGPDIDAIADAELIKLVTELKNQTRILTLENEILEKTILRLEPSLMYGVYHALEYAIRLNSSSSTNTGSYIKSPSSKYTLVDTFSSPSRMLTSPSRASYVSRKIDSVIKISGTVICGLGPRINVLERSELISKEMEVMINNLNKVRGKAAKQRAILTAQQEEIGKRVTDIDKATTIFNQNVLIEGWDKIAQRIPAEIWIRFMTEWMKLTDSIIGKLRLRTSTLNTQYSKLKGQIKVKTELSESLRPVDFEKIKIENSECLKSIDHKMQQLVGLKKLTGDANLNLSIHKKAMMEQNNYVVKVLDTIKNKEQQTIELDKERDLIQLQADILSQKLDEIRKVKSAYQVPDVMDYVNVKWEMTNLKHTIKTLENRVHIQQIALASINRKLQTLVSETAKSNNSASEKQAQVSS